MIARDDEPIRLTEDEIDDVLYAVRINDSEELSQTLNALQRNYSCSAKDIVMSAVAEDSGNSALHYAAANGLTALTSHLLSILALPPDAPFLNKRNIAGSTALHWASLNGHLDTVKALVAAGANLWLRNEAGNLAVFEAERAGKDDVVAYLLQVGGTEKENEGGTAAAQEEAGSIDEAEEREVMAAAVEGQAAAVGETADGLAAANIND